MKTRLLISIMTLFASLLASQGETAASSGDLRAALLGEWKGGDLYVIGADGEAAQLNFPTVGYSTPIPFERGKPVKFFAKTEDKETPFALVATTEIATEHEHPLVLLIPQAEPAEGEAAEEGAGQRLECHVLDLDPKTFPFGGLDVVNLSSEKLVVEMDEDRQEVEPGGQHLYAPMKGSQVKVGIRMSPVDGDKVVYSTLLIRRPHKRGLMVVIDDPVGPDENRINVKILVDFKPADK